MRITNVLFIPILLLLLPSCNTKVTGDKKQKPNLIVIVTDDQGYGDLGHHGNPWIKTPNLDKFAAQSLELTNFHVGTTCAPTRAGIMTGRNANRSNAWHTIAGCSILKPEEETMAQVFEKNGYKTAMFGKWHLGDNYPYRPHDRGFQNAIYHGGGGIGQTPDLWNNNYFNDTYFRNGIPEKFEGYCTDVWFNEAKDFISKNNSAPFFVYLATNAAHHPFNVPEEYAKMYENTELMDYQKRFYGMITNIDDNFGKLIEYLKKKGEYDNTIIVFTTDNGTAAGITYDKIRNLEIGYNAGLKGTKGSHYDGGHRVPFFISWPNGEILKNKSLNTLAAHVDLLPTLTSLSKIPFKPKNTLDGTDISQTLTGEKDNIERMLVIDTQRNQWPEKNKNSSVMSTTYRLVNNSELYNTINDPGQKVNIANENPEIVAKMQKFYNNWWASIEPEFTHAKIPIGYSEHEPVDITVHDMHSTENIPWNQVQIREGKFYPKGYYSIKVVKDGTYSFKLKRYPFDSSFKLNQAVTSIPETPYIDGSPEGNQISVSTGIIKMNDLTFNGLNNTNDEFIQIEATLKKGNYKMESSFLLSDGNEVPAYYTQIQTLK